MDRLRKLAEETFAIPENEGRSKVVSLAEAIERNVLPGMMLLFCNPASAIVYQIIRQFRGQKPGFTIVNRVPSIGMDLVHSKLVKKVIASSVGETYPHPGVNEAFTRAFKEGTVDFEFWSLACISLRLIAGGLGVGFMPTRSMIGTSMAEENNDSVRVMSDPFGSGREVAIVKALNPDLAFVHAWASDQHGNAILPPASVGAMGASYWSSFASTKGIVLTTEKIVSTAFIREHSFLVKIPGYRVNSVSIVPFGSHPVGLYNWGVQDFVSYYDDIDFQVEHRQAARDKSTLDAWLKEWVLDCSTTEAYLSKLGHERLAGLQEKATVSFWNERLNSNLERVSTSIEANSRETMIVGAARKIGERIIKGDYKTLLCGGGTALVASWLAACNLKRKGYGVELITGSGMFGTLPRPGNPYVMSVPNMATCKMIEDSVISFGFFISGENRKSMSILGAAQIDRYGNLNSGRLSVDTFLRGAGGASDAYQASEVLAVLDQRKTRFLERVSYITSPGKSVKTLVSNLGIFEKLDNDEDFTLTTCLPDPERSSLKSKISNIQDQCGWELKVSSNLSEFAPVEFEELMTLRLIDPEGYFRLRDNH